jgi:hypothetical protein
MYHRPDRPSPSISFFHSSFIPLQYSITFENARAGRTLNWEMLRGLNHHFFLSKQVGKDLMMIRRLMLRGVRCVDRCQPRARVGLCEFFHMLSRDLGG